MKIIRKHISEIEQIERKIIDEFIEKNWGTIFHEIEFNKLASETFNTELFYFISYKKDKLIGVCPVHTFKKGLVKHLFSNLSSFEIPYGGWVFDKSQTSLKKLLSNTRLSFNEVLFYTSNIQIIKEKSRHPDKKMKKLNTVVVGLSPSIDELFGKYKSKTRNKIKRARKLGITIEQIPCEKFEEFRLLAHELKERVGLSNRTDVFYRRVFETYSRAGSAVCLAAKLKNRYISSMILLANKNFTIAWVAGRKNNLPNNLYQNELLFWESIAWGKKYNSRYFDLCGLDEKKLPQLSRLKLSLSKNIVPFYKFNKRSLRYRVLSKLQKIF